jgi:hypothetical protein
MTHILFKLHRFCFASLAARARSLLGIRRLALIRLPLLGRPGPRFPVL